MKVYILFHTEDYESTQIFGIFSTKQKAELAKTKCADSQANGMTINEVELDTIQYDKHKEWSHWLVSYWYNHKKVKV